MVDFTEKQIRESFMKLLNEKPLKQITVRDIVDDCGISRNTFYYHFQDIPALIENIVEESSKNLLKNHPEINTIEECLDISVSYILDNRKAVMHIYKSVNRDFFEYYHWKICGNVVRSYMDRKFAGINISDSDREVIVFYVKSLVYGVVMGWLQNDLTDDIQIFIHRICELKQGDLEDMVKKCTLP